MAGTKSIATKVALAAITDVVKTATEAVRDLTDAITDMADSLRRIEQLLDEQTDYLAETRDVVADKAESLSAPTGSSAKKGAATQNSSADRASREPASQ